mgnify:CR=1 FL=1
MWSIKQTLNSFEDVYKYLREYMDFHDYKIGHLSNENNKVFITIEEDEKNSTGLIWYFEFENIEKFIVDNDNVMGYWIMEVEKGQDDNEIMFNLDSGYIEVKAEKVKLGLPNEWKK